MAPTPENTLTRKKVVPAKAEVENRFAKGLCLYKLVWIFAIGCLLGYLIETIFCSVFSGVFIQRKGMIYGPFNQIYGLGAVIMTLVLHPLIKRNNLLLFAVGAVLGGAFEYVCSLVQETVFGTVSWDYTGQPTNIGGRTNLIYMAFWGLLAVFYTRVLYPLFTNWIERISLKKGAVLTWVLVVFFAFNLLVSGIAVNRWNNRQDGIAPQNSFDAYIDSVYPDQRMEEIYQSMRKV